MRKYFNIIFSSAFSMAVLVLFIVVIGVATFIENSFDTNSAKQLIFNNKYFELLLAVLVFLYIGLLIKKKLFSKDKIPQLILHSSFILMIVGGGVTRHFGFEGDMHILNNESVNTIYSSKPYINIKIENDSNTLSSESPIYFSQIEDNSFELEFEIREGRELKVIFNNYIFNNEVSDNQKLDEINLDLEYKARTYPISLFYDKSNYTQKHQNIKLDDIDLSISYGPKLIELPFYIRLNKFVLTKYPGTNLPSSSESNITLIDNKNNHTADYTIAKNQVLDYEGYRFFQTSYDEDENGTLLSVNYDYNGTRISYLAYALMFIGFILIFFSKNTHFGRLNKRIQGLRDKRRSLLSVIFLLCVSSSSFSQNATQNVIDKDHSEKIGKLVVQNYDGRFSPVHSLAADAIHKITGKNRIFSENKGRLDEMQLFLDILVDPDYWRNQKIINVSNESISNILEVKGKYASFNDFMTANNEYKLEELAQNAFLKEESFRTKYDKDIIKVTDRVRVLNLTISGSLLKLFPVQNSKNNKWISWNDSLAFKPLHGELLLINKELQLKDFTFSNIMRAYLISTISARETGDYFIPNKIATYIGSIQRQLTPENILPSENKIALEILYNKLRIFDLLKYAYGFLGLLLLVLAFINEFGFRSGKIVTKGLIVLSIFIFISFVVQTFGMILRWYLSGHAPWSNSYEVMLLISWGSILSGILVFKNSKITLAAVALISSILLIITSLSYYDPQLTNLPPVLKSYWLIIHVSIITIGYSFLAVSFMLGIFNLFIITFQLKNRLKVSNLIFQELTLINEKFLTIGLALTAAGTFLGGVWANESWGRYWGWDPKETWSLIIILVYGLILHFKYIPKMKSPLAFNIGAVLSFGSVLMTFVGVNYYFTKGLHSYASDDPPIFPVWAWISIIALLLLITAAIFKEKYVRNSDNSDQ